MAYMFILYYQAHVQILIRVKIKYFFTLIVQIVIDQN